MWQFSCLLVSQLVKHQLCLKWLPCMLVISISRKLRQGSVVKLEFWYQLAKNRVCAIQQVFHSVVRLVRTLQVIVHTFVIRTSALGSDFRHKGVTHTSKLTNVVTHNSSNSSANGAKVSISKCVYYSNQHYHVTMLVCYQHVNMLILA